MFKDSLEYSASGEAGMHRKMYRMVRLTGASHYKLSGTSPIKYYYIYILNSINHNFIYVGFTENLKRRLIQHNNKEELSTKAYSPFKLIHYEAYRNEQDAKRREKYFKTTKGKTTLRYMIKEYLQVNK